MKNFKVAITGGIGSGKSTVGKIISEMGYLVVSCDDVYKDLLSKKDFVLKICEVTETEPIMCEKGGLSIDSRSISSKIFSDNSIKTRLENLTHPAIMGEVFNRLNKHEGLCFAEVPLLFESNLQGEFDGVIVVMRDREARVQSVVARSNLKKEEVIERINNQFDYENFDKKAHTVIYNDSSFEELKIKTEKVLCGFYNKI